MRFGVLQPGGALVALAFAAFGCAGAASAPPAVGAEAVTPEAPAWALVTIAPGRAAVAAEPGAAIVAWSYRAGAALAAPPGIGADGSVVVGSVDGYLHALRGDGSFRWGYTLRGPVVGRPAVGSNGAVFAAADPNGLYALDGDGTLLWVSSVLGGVRSPPVLDRDSQVWVATGQGTLLGYSHRGGLVGFARLGGAKTLGPTPLPEGGVAVANVEGNVRIAGNPGPAPRAAAGAPLIDLEVGQHGFFVVGAAGLSRFDASDGEERWSRTSVTRVACSSPALVVVEDQGLCWLSPAGEPRAHVSVAVGPQRAIACLDDGSLLLQDDAGILLRVDASGVRARARLPPGRLVSLDPVRGGFVIAGYRDGRVLALKPPG